MGNVIEIKDGLPRFEQHRMANPVNLEIARGENVAIVGRNGAGKSRLVDILTARRTLVSGKRVFDFTKGGELENNSNLASDNIRHIAFRDSYGPADNEYFYQMRWNSVGVDDSPLVSSYLPEDCDECKLETLSTLLGLRDMLDKPVIQLSSGELRKFQLLRVLVDSPSMLVLDNPFIGLDVSTRAVLRDLLSSLVKDYGVQLLLVLSKPEEIPDFVDSVIPVEGLFCEEKLSREDYLNSLRALPEHPAADRAASFMEELDKKELACESVVRLEGVTIRYGSRTILKDLDWEVRRGEKWVLRGNNGSGKSTLLSLVCADNPQSYSCNLTLFGRRRGTGESIWDIKKHIGYVSPEMHRSYQKSHPAIEIVASGLHDNIGLYRKVSKERMDSCLKWMRLFGIEELAERNYLELSSGEQRMVLLARAFVKDPDLLILDEPFHGLDPYNFRVAKDILEAWCHREEKTLIMVTHYDEELPDCITDTLILHKSL